MAQLIATAACGVFFGAALYISVVQQPAVLEAGGGVAGRYFPPMYRRAAALQIASAATGAAAGVIAWAVYGDIWWLVGGLILFSVVPLTLFWIKPINDQLLDPRRDPESSDTEWLLRRWGARHAIRVVLSGVAFMIFLWRSTHA